MGQIKVCGALAFVCRCPKGGRRWHHAPPLWRHIARFASASSVYCPRLRAPVFSIWRLLVGGEEVSEFLQQTRPPREPRCGESVCPLEAFAIELMLAYLSRALP